MKSEDFSILSDSFWEEMYTRSAFLSERLDSKRFRPVAHCDNGKKIKRRIARWKEVLGKEGEQRFQNRMEWSDLSSRTLRPRLGEVVAKQPDLEIDWMRTLRKIMETARTEGEALRGQSIPTPLGSKQSVKGLSRRSIARLPIQGALLRKTPIPFEELYLPLLLVARRRLSLRLAAEHPKDTLPLTRRAFRQLERSLLQRISFLANETLLREFHASLPFHQAVQLVLLKEGSRNPSRERYTDFVSGHLAEGYQTLFETYPVLARLICTTIDSWVDHVAEFLIRLQQDRAQLLSGDTSEPVTDLQCDLSDPHHRGRTVLAVTFSGGKRWVYKPKSMRVEMAFLDLLDWVNRKGLSRTLRVLDVIAKEDYGWVEFVDHRPCRSRQEVRDFYHRAGSLLSILYALGTTDCHHENLIADRDQFILIDMETASCPAMKNFLPKREKASESPFQHSVLNSGLLPCWQCVSDSQIQFNVSGLGASRASSWSGKQLHAVNTDEMRMTSQTISPSGQSNLPLLGKKVVPPQNYLSECMQGFEEGYQLLLAHRRELLSPKGPLASWKSGRARVVIRPTRVYFQLQQQMMRPEFLREGVDWSIELERLYLAYLDGPKAPRMWGAVDLELASMHRMDIPYFYSEVGERTLVSSSGGRLDRLYLHPMLDEIRGRIRKLKANDLRFQADLTYTSLASETGPSRSQGETEQLRGDWSAAPRNLSTFLKAEISGIADDLTRHAVRSSGGDLYWLGAQFQETSSNFTTSILGTDLYGGTNGIALFLAAADQELSPGKYRATVLAALRSHTTRAARAQRETLYRKSPNPPLGLSGMGGDLYILVRVASFLGKKSLIQEASRMAHLLKPRHIRNDKVLDIIGGSAGLLLGLLSLYQETEERSVLERAIQAGDHLLSSRILTPSGLPTWDTLGTGETHPLTGFSHGAAGIALALIRLASVTDRDRFRKGAEDGLRYERSVYCPNNRNWPDFRSMEEGEIPGFPSQWCHGATGIGLARLGML
ncbi:MAG: type 2 lanthipeptide synthetase LanM family protein, partial [Planctomycetota bacterium]|nr:type 2 lanthipeptide synthetase LanM family protein [Planctomycetota bacterium]